MPVRGGAASMTPLLFQGSPVPLLPLLCPWHSESVLKVKAVLRGKCWASVAQFSACEVISHCMGMVCVCAFTCTRLSAQEEQDKQALRTEAPALPSHSETPVSDPVTVHFSSPGSFNNFQGRVVLRDRWERLVSNGVWPPWRGLRVLATVTRACKATSSCSLIWNSGVEFKKRTEQCWACVWVTALSRLCQPWHITRPLWDSVSTSTERAQRNNGSQV